MASTASALLRVAAQQIGTMEGRDRDGNWNNLQKFGAWYGMNGVAWCDIFISWVAANSGNADIIPKSAYVPGRLGWARSRNLSGHWPPAPGDIGIVHEERYVGNGQTTPYYAHVFYVEKYLGNGVVQTIEGNTNNGGSAQGNGVYRLHRQDSESGGRYIYIRPQYADESAPLPAPTQGGGQSGPIHVPTGKSVAPNKPQTGISVRVSNLQRGLGSRNESDDNDIAQYNKRLWECHGPAYKTPARVKAWEAESSQVYGKATSQATYDLYAALRGQFPKDPRWVTLPTQNLAKNDPAMPGEELLKWMGFGIIR